MGMTVGIDLGTTNSVACIKKVDVLTIRNEEGSELTPSCVTAVPNHDHSSFNLIVGSPSRDLIKQYPEYTITSIKRLIGRDFEDTEVQSIIANNCVSYKITTKSTEPGSIHIPFAGDMYTPEMISGIILKKLISDSEIELNGKIEQAVVTVPAYFSDRQKFATRAACDYAGIKLLRLLPEPTAAALSFGLEIFNQDKSQTILVFDLGGGTFDISVLSFSGKSFMEVTKGGDMWLGGDNIDQLIIDHVYACVEKESKCKPLTELVETLSLADKSKFLTEIKEKAEIAKIKLSKDKSATVEMFGLLKNEKNQLIDIDVKITRDEFNQLLEPLVQRVSIMATHILNEIRFEPELIDTVLMVGGSSLVPAIQDEVRKIFGREKVIIHSRPMLAVAEGSALMAAKMTRFEKEEFSMMHSTAHDYYLQLAGGKRHLLVARNTPLPVTIKEKLVFSHNEQLLARLRVFNGADGVLEPVGELWFHKDIESDLRKENDVTKLMLGFTVDEDNIITMVASSLQNKQYILEAKIARGWLASKLYNDLEQSLSLIISSCQDSTIGRNALRMSQTIVSTILSASNPITGEIIFEQKQKAQLQIKTLKRCQQEGLTPLSQYEFLIIAQNNSSNILSKEESSRLDKIVNSLKKELLSLNNIDNLKTLDKEAEDFFDEYPVSYALAKAENVALQVEEEHPTESKKIRKMIKEINVLNTEEDRSLFQAAQEKLNYFIYSNFSFEDEKNLRFDRDVCL